MITMEVKTINPKMKLPKSLLKDVEDDVFFLTKIQKPPKTNTSTAAPNIYQIPTGKPTELSSINVKK